MSITSNVRQFIKSMNVLTTNKKVEWKLVSVIVNQSYALNPDLYDYIHKHKAVYATDRVHELLEYESYFCEHSDGYIYIFTHVNYKTHNRYLVLGIQNDRYSGVVPVNLESEFQPELEDMKFLVANSRNNIESLMDKIIFEANEALE